jgi:hypothetical protein
MKHPNNQQKKSLFFKFKNKKKAKALLIYKFYIPFHIHIVNNIETTIILDLKRDLYLILLKEEYVCIKHAIANNFYYDGKNFQSKKNIPFENFNKILKKLLEKQLLLYVPIKLLKNKKRGKIIEVKNRTPGMENIDWKIDSLYNYFKPCFFMILKSYFMLIFVHIMVKLTGLSFLISLLHFLKINKPLSLTTINKKKLLIMVSSLNKATQFYPYRIKCLEWSVALSFLCLLKKYKTTFNIGIQNYPFVSHAWVEVEDKVICDDKNLPKKLLVILTVPI